MKRLTKRNEKGIADFCGKYGDPPYPVVTQETIEKLADYKDPGFTPEEIACMAQFLKEQTSEEVIADNMKTVTRLLEWSKWKAADEEGRLVVLPCKVGDTVWFVGTECDKNDCWEYSDYCHRGCEKLKTPKIRETTIRQFCLKGNQFDSMTDTDALYSSTSEYFYLQDIGKTVFLTREEAKAALEKMKGETK